MGALQDILLTIIGTIASLYIVIILARFLLQLVRASFYNPVSSFIVTATNPILIPLRKVIPGFFGVDVACLVMAFLFEFITIILLGFISFGDLVPIGTALLWSLIGLLSIVTNIYLFGILIMVVISWVAPHSNNPAVGLIASIIEPLLKPIRRIIPPMGGMDFTPLIGSLALYIPYILLKHMATNAGIVGSLHLIVPGI